MTSLTILIPTTGNLDKLKINLLFLIKQTSKDFKIFIGNNSSNNLEPFLNNFRKQLRIKLYNNNKELLAVAKLAQPLPLSDITDTNIMVNLDL